MKFISVNATFHFIQLDFFHTGVQMDCAVVICLVFSCVTLLFQRKKMN